MLEVTSASYTLKLFDELINHSVSLDFSETDPGLKDLFSTTGDSELCFPAALAYELTYQRQYRQSPLATLPAVDTRSLATECHTDLQVGTTMPQAVSCITQHYTTAGMTPTVTVAGLDSKWQANGLYPPGTSVRSGAIQLDELRADLNKDGSVIMLVGFYGYDTKNHAWSRIRGHFFSVTGYGWRSTWGEDLLSLDAVNPAVDYSARGATGRKWDQLLLQKIDPELAQASGGVPDGIAYQLTGPGFTGTDFVTLVESTVTFSAVKP